MSTKKLIILEPTDLIALTFTELDVKNTIVKLALECEAKDKFEVSERYTRESLVLRKQAWEMVRERYPNLSSDYVSKYDEGQRTLILFLDEDGDSDE